MADLIPSADVVSELELLRDVFGCDAGRDTLVAIAIGVCAGEWRREADGKWRFWLHPAEVDGEDGGGDPTTTDLLKPRGNGGVVDAFTCHLALSLVGDVDAGEELAAAWSQAQRDVAYDWAVRCHLQASDNDDVIVPPRPDFIPRRNQTMGSKST